MTEVDEVMHTRFAAVMYSTVVQLNWVACLFFFLLIMRVQENFILKIKFVKP